MKQLLSNHGHKSETAKRQLYWSEALIQTKKRIAGRRKGFSGKAHFSLQLKSRSVTLEIDVKKACVLGGYSPRRAKRRKKHKGLLKNKLFTRTEDMTKFR